MKFKSYKENKHTSMDGLTVMLIVSVLFVLVNVILTLNGLSPFEYFK